MVIATLLQNAKVAQDIIAGAVGRLPYERTCECATALQYALLTRPEAMSAQVKKDLASIIGKYVGTRH
jgi:5'-methylthioadenosine phosphorylase